LKPDDVKDFRKGSALIFTLTFDEFCSLELSQL